MGTVGWVHCCFLIAKLCTITTRLKEDKIWKLFSNTKTNKKIQDENLEWCPTLHDCHPLDDTTTQRGVLSMWRSFDWRIWRVQVPQFPSELPKQCRMHLGDHCP